MAFQIPEEYHLGGYHPVHINGVINGVHIIQVGPMEVDRVKLTAKKETYIQVNLGKTVKHICTIEEPVADTNCQKERDSQDQKSVSEASELLEPVGYVTHTITIYQKMIYQVQWRGS